MKESQISDALRESMNAVRLSPALRARALCAMCGGAHSMSQRGVYGKERDNAG